MHFAGVGFGAVRRFGVGVGVGVGVRVGSGADEGAESVVVGAASVVVV